MNVLIKKIGLALMLNVVACSTGFGMNMQGSAQSMTSQSAKDTSVLRPIEFASFGCGGCRRLAEVLAEKLGEIRQLKKLIEQLSAISAEDSERRNREIMSRHDLVSQKYEVESQLSNCWIRLSMTKIKNEELAEENKRLTEENKKIAAQLAAVTTKKS